MEFGVPPAVALAGPDQMASWALPNSPHPWLTLHQPPPNSPPSVTACGGVSSPPPLNAPEAPCWSPATAAGVLSSSPALCSVATRASYERSSPHPGSRGTALNLLPSLPLSWSVLGFPAEERMSGPFSFLGRAQALLTGQVEAALLSR